MYLRYLTARTADLSAYTTRSSADYNAALDLVQHQLEDEPRIGDAATLALQDDIDAATAMLQPLADRTQLDDAIAVATDLDASDGSSYTPSSFAAFRASYAAFETAVLDGVGMTVNAVVASDDVSVAEAEAALSAVNAAFGLLILRPDKATLTTAYEAAETADLSAYTPSSTAAFVAGLTSVKSVIDDPEALQEDVDAATIALDQLYTILVLIADKSELVIANNASIIAFYEERNDYTSSSFTDFHDAVTAYGTYLAVNAVLADSDVSQAQVDAMLANVTNALSLLVLRADTDELVAAYDTLSDADLSGYTPSSVTVYESALSAAWVVAIDDDTDQTEADAALTALLAAPGLLVTKADKSGLASVVAETADIRAAIYSNSSYQAMELLVVRAEQLLADEDALQADVDALSVSIEGAIDNLVLRNSGVVLREGSGTADVKLYVTLGESTIESYVVSDPTILSIDADGIVTGLKYGTATVTVGLANGIVEEVTFIVKAKIKTATMIYALLIPALASGGAVAMVLWNEKTTQFFRKLRIFRKTVRP
jgi:hypothetical protein